MCSPKEAKREGREIVGRQLLHKVCVLRSEPNGPHILVVLLVKHAIEGTRLMEQSVNEVEEKLIREVGAKK